MQYYVTLNGREFPLTLLEAAAAGHALRGAERELGIELLTRCEGGRPALVLVDGVVHRVLVQAVERGKAGAAAQRVTINGRSLELTVETELERRARPRRNEVASATSHVHAPMPGRVVKVNVRPGDTVAAGAPLLGIEAMKMENELLAPSAGRVAKVNVQVGATVEADQELISIEPQ